MNNFEKQVLINQKVIMLALHQINNYESTQEGLNREWENTDKLLYPKQKKPIEDRTREGITVRENEVKEKPKKKKIILAIYNDGNHTRDNIAFYKNTITGKNYDKIPEGFEVVYSDQDGLLGLNEGGKKQ